MKTRAEARSPEALAHLLLSRSPVTRSPTQIISRKGPHSVIFKLLAWPLWRPAFPQLPSDPTHPVAWSPRFRSWMGPPDWPADKRAGK